MGIRIHEGVTASVNAKMNAVHANVLREDGALFRTCEHGVRHPVGNIHTGYVERKDREVHDQAGRCCEQRCCENWALESSAVTS